MVVRDGIHNENNTIKLEIANPRPNTCEFPATAAERNASESDAAIFTKSGVILPPSLDDTVGRAI
jgi:hypothetical protein